MLTLTGMVMKVDPWEFKGNDGKMVQMVNLEVYSDPVGLLHCRMSGSGNGPLPEQYTGLQAQIRRINWDEKNERQVYVLNEVQSAPVPNAPRPAMGQYTPPAAPPKSNPK